MARDITKTCQQHVLLVINSVGKILCPEYGTVCDLYLLDWYWNETADWKVWWVIRETVVWHELCWCCWGCFLYLWRGWSQWSRTWGWGQYPDWWSIWGHDGGRASISGQHLLCSLWQIYWHWRNNGCDRIRPKEENSHTYCWRLGRSEIGDVPLEPIHGYLRIRFGIWWRGP